MTCAPPKCLFNICGQQSYNRFLKIEIKFTHFGNLWIFQSVALLALVLFQCIHLYPSVSLFPRSESDTNLSPLNPCHPEYLARYSPRFLLSSIPDCALVLIFVLPSSAHAKTHHPRRWRYYILGWRYRESRGAAYRSAYIEIPDATDALPKGLPPCLASDGHEPSVWMFPGSYHMILDVSCEQLCSNRKPYNLFFSTNIECIKRFESNYHHRNSKLIHHRR